MERKRQQLSDKIKKYLKQKPEQLATYDGITEKVISTGSTLLDLAISGGRVRGGGIPSGILIEIFGPPSSGKTIMLCEIAGNIQKQGGQIMFRDPEARLNKEFAQLFGLEINEMEYEIPSTVPEVFKPIRLWDPQPDNIIHGVFADSLAALTTDQEVEDKDQYGMRRAKEFSEELRKTCRIIRQKNYLVVCSNQVRQNLDAGPYGQKYKAPGGEAIGFYSSLRLRCSSPTKMKRKLKIHGKEISKVVGVETEVEVFKSSVWEPYHKAPLYIVFDYGIDNVRGNLKFLKEITDSYNIGDLVMPQAIDKACETVERGDLERLLEVTVIDLWEEMEAKFKQSRKQKH